MKVSQADDRVTVRRQYHKQLTELRSKTESVTDDSAKIRSYSLKPLKESQASDRIIDRGRIVGSMRNPKIMVTMSSMSSTTNMSNMSSTTNMSNTSNMNNKSNTGNTSNISSTEYKSSVSRMS